MGIAIEQLLSCFNVTHIPIALIFSCQPGKFEALADSIASAGNGDTGTEETLLLAEQHDSGFAAVHNGTLSDLRDAFFGRSGNSSRLIRPRLPSPLDRRHRRRRGKAVCADGIILAGRNPPYCRNPA